LNTLDTILQRREHTWQLPQATIGPLFVVFVSYYNLKNLTINVAAANNPPKIISDVNGYVIAKSNAEKIRPIVVTRSQPPQSIISIRAITVAKLFEFILFDF